MNDIYRIYQFDFKGTELQIHKLIPHGYRCWVDDECLGFYNTPEQAVEDIDLYMGDHDLADYYEVEQSVPTSLSEWSRIR
ncbi:hypothetical protein [Francisella philomiragia]|nr:hypothetical protein [Francisella philomiragia]